MEAAGLLQMPLTPISMPFVPRSVLGIFTNLAPLRSALERIAPERIAPSSFAPERSAPLRRGLTSGFSSRHIFQAATPFSRMASCSSLAMGVCMLSGIHLAYRRGV